MSTRRITFEEVRLHAVKSGKCGCGKRRRRQRYFWQTINPFNQGADGLPKSRDEIYNELKVKRSEWMAEPITCDDCWMLA